MTAQPTVGSRAGDAAEWRMVTVLFADLVDSVGLASRIDPEDLREALLAWRETAVAAIGARGGVVARFVGDGVLAYFGYPAAHEDDARRAIDAALDLVAATRALPPPPGETRPLRVRCGIHSGAVIIGDLGSGDSLEAMAAVGEVPNLAARLHGAAGPDEVVVSAATHELAARWFDCAPTAGMEFKGLAGRFEVWRVVGRRPAPAGPVVWGRPDLPLTGRTQELALLIDRWNRARGGRGQMLVLEADAGLGKSRLVRELIARAGAGADILFCRCAVDRRASALQPVVELFGEILGIGPDDAPETRSARLRDAAAARVDEASRPEVLRSLAQMLAIHGADAGATGAADRARQFDALNRWIIGGASGERPVMLVVEDLHWADESTCAWLATLAPLVEQARILVLATGRPGAELAGVGALRNATKLILDRLASEEAQLLARACEGGRDLAPAVIDEIAARSDGVPLFVEELTRAIVAGGGRSPADTDAAQLPLTLRDLLSARLDQLGRHKRLAQIASVLGRSFDDQLLRAVWGDDPADLDAGCRTLVEAGILVREPAPAGSAYSFRHALIQDAAYRSMVRKTRAELHRHVARVMLAQFPARIEAAPEVVARHHAKGGSFAEAVAAYETAGRRFAERSASGEAVQQYRNASSALRQLPESRDRDHHELELLIAQGAQLIAARGNAAPEVLATYAEARALAERVPDTPLRFRVLRGLQTFYIVRGDVRVAREIGEQILRQASRSGDADLLLQAHRPHGLCLAYLGEFEAARDHLRAAGSLYDPRRHEGHRFAYGSDPGVLAACNLAWVEWMLGRPGEANRQARAAIESADAIDHPHSQCFALSLGGSLRQFDGDPAGARAHALRVVALCDKHRFPYWSAWARLLIGWADATGDAGAGGIRDIGAAIASYRATGAELMRPYFLGLLVEARLRQGQELLALSDVHLALELAQRSGVRFYEPELCRLKAVLTARGDPAAARVELERGIALASAQRSLAMELRSRIALHELEGAERTGSDAGLAACVDRFAPGEDSTDLRRARLLVAARRSATPPSTPS